MPDDHGSASDQVDRYLALDLNHSAPVAQALLSRAAEEARQRHLTLTAAGEDGAMSPHLTPVMNEWVNTHVEMHRGQALGALEAQARNIRISASAEGVLLEVEQDKAERHQAKRHLEVMEKFNRDHKKDLEQRAQLQGEYDLMRAELGGRDAKVPSKILEFGVLIPLIMIPESLLNFESFRRAPIIQSDAMALGATILVGIGIAAAAYCIGLFIRRFSYYNEPDNTERPRAGWPLYTWGTLALTISLGSVAAARYYYLLPRIQEAQLLGEAIPNIPMSIGSLLFGNLICFLVGAIFTFFLNDENPDYAHKAELLRKLDRKLKRLNRTQVTAALDQVDARTKQLKDIAKRRADQMNGKPGYSALRERMARVLTKDSEVIGLLQSYRTALVNEIKNSQSDFVFEVREPSADRSDPTTPVSVDRFAALTLKLYRSK
jgi:hypothetical protein